MKRGFSTVFKSTVLTLCISVTLYNPSDQITNKNILCVGKSFRSVSVNISCANFVLGDVVVEPKTPSGSVFSFKTLKSRFSEPQREQDHSPVKREVCLLDVTTRKVKH